MQVQVSDLLKGPFKHVQILETVILDHMDFWMLEMTSQT